MIASDNNWKTPLGVYEKEIEELRNARTELQETQISQNTSKVSITMPSVIIAKNEQKIEYKK
jgi:hypothetical protein